MKRKNTKKNINGFFDFNSYSSQQIAKLIAERICTNLIANKLIRTVDEKRLPLKFQSQWCEDVILYSIFKNKKRGYYVEIGAFDGVKLSNTYFFECLGWNGLLVEPQPKQFELLKTNRPNSQCENVCISLLNNNVTLNIIDNEAYETWSYVDDKEENKLSELGFTTKAIKVKCKTIDELLPDTINSIDFISIDVEGMELEVLKTLNIEKYQPEIILLENPEPAIEVYLNQFGYTCFYKTWINFFYAKNIDKYAHLNVFDLLGIEIKG